MKEYKLPIPHQLSRSVDLKNQNKNLSIFSNPRINLNKIKEEDQHFTKTRATPDLKPHTPL